MATASAGFKSREEHRKQQELETARKAGLAPAEIDEDGNEINPHIPQFMAGAPWYLYDGKPSLKHQRKQKKPDPNNTNSWYDRGATTFQADRYRKGSCENCGAMSHKKKSCPERPRKVGAIWTNKNIAPDEKIESFDLPYDAKRDRWHNYSPAQYAAVIEWYDARDEARSKFLKEEHLTKLEKKSKKPLVEEESSDKGGYEDPLKLDESKLMHFAKVEKRVRTTLV
uniref:Pre-mRNA-splicing factor SLU7 n=1 Tax=Noccaea caerulescens TaxID=107243 RepID=A0A1J3DMN4_NOCCA